MIQICVICQKCNGENLLTIVDGDAQTQKCAHCQSVLLDYFPVNGYIYVLSNPRMPGLLKIGFTKRLVGERIEELSSATGVPAKFTEEASFLSNSPEEDEKRIHELLISHRVESKEFFEVDLTQALEIIEFVVKRPPFYLDPQQMIRPPEKLPRDHITETLPGDVNIEFVYIPPGTFVMGLPASEPERSECEAPQHEVTISKGFYLGKCVVTQGQWKAVMGTTPWLEQSHVQENPDHPAVYVSWEDAQEFVANLNQVAGSELYRLSTEAEWEYACRAGATTRWSFGDDESQLGDYAWYDGNAWNIGEDYAHKVGTRKPNPWHLYDMHGNVYEWCNEWYGPYSSGAQIDPTGPSSGSNRVIRGGAFGNSARSVRSADRDYAAPSHRGFDVDFRLLRRAD